jgi:uncharacterized phage protein (TIGR02220 family)
MPKPSCEVFLQILDSSVAEDFTTRHIFEDFFKVADLKGVVDMTRQSLARRFNVPISVLNDAIERLSAPDPNSRDQAFGGRRIQKLDEHRDWGWQILNWQKYQDLKGKVYAYQRVMKSRILKEISKENAKDPTYSPESRAVLHFLNEQSGHHYRETSTNLGFIQERLNEDGVDIDGVRQMISRQSMLWKDDPRMARYLRPETLFNKTKFDSYYAMKDLPANIEKATDSTAPPLWKQIQILESRLEIHPANPSFRGYNSESCTEEMRQAYRDLKQKLEALRQAEMDSIQTDMPMEN